MKMAAPGNENNLVKTWHLLSILNFNITWILSIRTTYYVVRHVPGQLHLTFKENVMFAENVVPYLVIHLLIHFEVFNNNKNFTAQKRRLQLAFYFILFYPWIISLMFPSGIQEDDENITFFDGNSSRSGHLTWKVDSYVVIFTASGPKIKKHKERTK